MEAIHSSLPTASRRHIRRRRWLATDINFKLPSEKISALSLKRKAKERKVFQVLNPIDRKAHLVDDIPKILLQNVKVQLAKSDPKLSKIG